MGKSLQDQLLSAGLASGQQVKKVKSDKRKQEKLQRKNNLKVENENIKAAQQTQVEKLSRDRLLNQKLQQQAENKAIVAQIRDLIQANSQSQSQSQDSLGDAYHFSDAGKVKSIYISATQRQHLVQGKLAIVKLNKHYHLIATKFAKKISDRDASYVIQINDEMQNISTEDPYADFQIPDDLMW